jgi:large subunit ribosomal protein L29
MRKNAIKQLLPEERAERLTELRTELVRLRTMAVSGGTVEDPNRIREVKKTIARILTIENTEKSKRREN